MPAQILSSDETAKSSQHPSETEIFASPIRDKSNLPSGSGPNQALDANGLDPYWHSRSWRMLAKAEPKGWINWVLSTRCPVWTRKPSTSIRNPQVSCPNPPTDPPLAQNLLVLPITLDLATCNLQLAICDCDWRLAIWQLALAADNSLVDTPVCRLRYPEPGALHRTTPAANGGGGVFANWRETRRTKRGGHRADHRWASLPPLSLAETSLNPIFDETNRADITPHYTHGSPNARASTRLEATAQKITRQQRRFRAPKEYASGAAAPPRL